MAPTFAFYGDDFTGSIDVLLQLSRAGWSSRLYLDHALVDSSELSRFPVDAVGIAGIARSLSGDELDREVVTAFEALGSLAPAFVQYKTCSTADSSPTVGSLGRVLEIGKSFFGVQPIPILFAQPDFGRFTAFAHHFARENGTIYRLDRQPTMANHPSTPMTESDLTIHLSKQTDIPIGSITVDTYTSVNRVAKTLGSSNCAGVVMDAVSGSDLEIVGNAIVDSTVISPRFVMGSGGMTLAIASAIGKKVAQPVATKLQNRGMPMLAVSGSQSAQTQRQIAAAIDLGWKHFELPWKAQQIPPVTTQAIMSLRSGNSVILTMEKASFADNPVVALTNLLATAIQDVINAGACYRVAICGGDTSSRIMRLLGASSLEIAANPSDNLTICKALSNNPRIDGLEIALKGGQVGPNEYFEIIRKA